MDSYQWKYQSYVSKWTSLLLQFFICDSGIRFTFCLKARKVTSKSNELGSDEQELQSDEHELWDYS